MSISGKHFYRFKYLKSDHWLNLRLKKLVAQKGRCALCSQDAWGNDIHHVNYRRLLDVELKDLRVLCRECHEAVHDLLKRCPEIKAIQDPATQWSRVQRRLWKTYTVWKIIPKDRKEIIAMHAACFRTARHRLLTLGILCHAVEMPRCKGMYRAMWEQGYKTDLDILQLSSSLWRNHEFLLQNGEH